MESGYTSTPIVRAKKPCGVSHRQAGAGENDAKAEMVVSDSMEDRFPLSHLMAKSLSTSLIPQAPRRMIRVMFTSN